MADRPKRISKQGFAFLAELFPQEDLLTEPEHTAVFGADGGRGFTLPEAVVRPTQLSQIQALLQWANEERIPLYPRARATNLVGDCVPGRSGVVVSTLRMHSVVEFDPDDFVITVEPGMVTADLQAYVEKAGLFYPPDPASVKISTIGGNTATCAGGMRAVKYGVTRDYILGLEAVLPGGEVIHTGGRTHKNVVGLDLTRLLVGSEGTLAFITKIILKLLPKPESSASLLAGYASEEQALSAAREIFRAGILPSAMEFMGQGVMECLRLLKDVPWPETTKGALLLRLDGSPKPLEEELKQLSEVVSGTGPAFQAQGLGPEEEEPLWELRRLINPASFLKGPDKLADDITVPRGRVLQALAVLKEIETESGLPILVFGHLGDGNLHVNVMYDKAVPEQNQAAHKAKESILDMTVSLQGSLSGEHGIGRLKEPYMYKQIGARERDLMRRIKAVFDPHNIMNPGKAY